MDALPVTERSGLPFASTVPGKAHTCGHDIHTACLLGAAKLLHDVRDSFSGTVKLIFQPGEEVGSGAAAMIEDGVLQNPQMKAIFALHVWPDVAAGKVKIIAPDKFLEEAVSENVYAGTAMGRRALYHTGAILPKSATRLAAGLRSFVGRHPRMRSDPRQRAGRGACTFAVASH